MKINLKEKIYNTRGEVFQMVNEENKKEEFTLKDMKFN
jgi:hypothetical protein